MLAFSSKDSSGFITLERASQASLCVSWCKALAFKHVGVCAGKVCKRILALERAKVHARKTYACVRMCGSECRVSARKC